MKADLRISINDYQQKKNLKVNRVRALFSTNLPTRTNSPTNLNLVDAGRIAGSLLATPFNFL
jgi:hypothetical protein